ncbi:MAG: lipid-A-disaccharide synthase [Opitutales bacterium]|nr:lipid-A-disaccharide synthase [Opitutales bacterium]
MADDSHIELPAMEGRRVDVLFIAGEHSGDEHAAEVIRGIRKKAPELSIAAVGGGRMEAAGAVLLHDLTATSVVGLVEVLRHYRYFKRLFDALLRWVGEHRPRVVVLVDYPGFNLRFAAALKTTGLSRKGGGETAVYGYISPQIWAWKARRRFRMAEVLDELGVIFPFEVDCFADTELDTRFVGHPFLLAGAEPSLRFDAAGPVLLLPGSRLQPIGRILPAMLRGAAQARREGWLDAVTVIYPSSGARALIERIHAAEGGDSVLPRLDLVPAGESTGGRAVLTSSGTMSLSCALAGIPGAIVYRAHPLTYFIGRRVVSVPYLGIANLILKRPFYPEFIQGDATAANLACELRQCLHDPERCAAAAEGAVELRDALAAPAREGPLDRILDHMRRPAPPSGGR